MSASAFITSINPISNNVINHRSSFTCKLNENGNKRFTSSNQFIHSFSTNKTTTTTTTNNNNIHTKSIQMTYSQGLRNFRRSLINESTTKSTDVYNISNESIKPTHLKSSLLKNTFIRSTLSSTKQKALCILSYLSQHIQRLQNDKKYRQMYKFSKLAIGFSFALAMLILTKSPPSSTTSSIATISPPNTINSLFNKIIESIHLPPKIQSIIKPFTESFGVVFLSEFGDKSMFATALMAMKYNPFIVCLGAFLSLTIMTFIACFLGQLMHFLPAIVTHYSSIVLFVFFGIQMILQSRSLPDTPGGVGSERADAEEMVASSNNSNSIGVINSNSSTALNVFVKVSSLIFVAEWCDRSMLATMALAASSNTVAVIGGATLANIVCTGMAVCAASIVASKISERMVALIAGIMFEIFAVFTFIEGPDV